MTRETTLEKRWRKSGKSFATNGSISIATGSRSYWKVTPAPDNVWQSWFALDPIPSAASINVEWPWGLGCDSVQGTVLRNEIHMPAVGAVIVIKNSRNAIIRYHDGTVRRLKKASNDRVIVCE